MGRMKELSMSQVGKQFDDLFSYPARPGYRAEGTSRAAAVSIVPSASTLRERVLKMVTERPCTVHEASQAMSLDVATIQPRFSELRKLGKIEESGDTRPNKSGRQAAVWRRKA